jgi:hypothetical protein
VPLVVDVVGHALVGPLAFNVDGAAYGDLVARVDAAGNVVAVRHAKVEDGVEVVAVATGNSCERDEEEGETV